MEVAEFIVTLTKWVLGLVTLAIVGIIGMHVRISVFVQRLLSHEENCDKRWEENERDKDKLWTAIESLRNRR